MKKWCLIQFNQEIEYWLKAIGKNMGKNLCGNISKT